jgi:hypothetical protein
VRAILVLLPDQLVARGEDKIWIAKMLHDKELLGIPGDALP